MCREFRARRDLVVDGLNKIPGITCRKPTGAFYVFPSIKQLGMAAKQVETGLLEEAGVAVLAGTSFGYAGEGHIDSRTPTPRKICVRDSHASQTG